MIKIENTRIHGWEAAIRGMRNPMNSWDKSDSWHGCRSGDYGHTESSLCNEKCQCDCQFCIGQNDMKLMKQLVSAGTDHRKFMRMITVTCDIVAPMYWWKEFDTYKVGTVRNSCSTMHKIHEKEFTLDDFSHEHLITFGCKNVRVVDYGNRTPISVLETTINALNYWRECYLETHNKNYWWQMIQLLPSSYNQRATVQLNYQVLRNMYHSRKNHKLDEWHDFCHWIESLPYSELITAKESKTDE